MYFMYKYVLFCQFVAVRSGHKCTSMGHKKSKINSNNAQHRNTAFYADKVNQRYYNKWLHAWNKDFQLVAYMSIARINIIDAIAVRSGILNAYSSIEGSKRMRPVKETTTKTSIATGNSSIRITMKRTKKQCVLNTCVDSLQSQKHLSQIISHIDSDFNAVRKTVCFEQLVAFLCRYVFRFSSVLVGIEIVRWALDDHRQF